MKPSMLAAAVLVFGLAAHQAIAGNQSSAGFEMPLGEMFAESLPHGPGRSPERESRRAGGAEEAGEPASPLFQAIYSVGGQALPAWSQRISGCPTATMPMPSEAASRPGRPSSSELRVC
ncbi:hypothetical protein [Azotobacter chroococcum]|uniref:hypothetical protein n=1 Tax=Azotobacter chroococcum TaxID=353 RepID=UPI0010ADC586|nr:hypothetical protein [Azotobacter chroococcum]TKD40159.1 hypothetical protein FCG41_11420 [Azotobacter chroococcum]